MHGNKEFWNDRALWSYNEKSCLLYKIQLVYAQYCTYISAFLVQKKAVINTFITTLFLRLFPMKGLHLHCLKAIAQVYP